MSNGSDLVCCDIAAELGQSTLRQVVGFQLVGEDQLAELGDHVVVTADDSLEHAFMCKVVSAAAVAVALCCCVEKGQITGMTGLKEALLQSFAQGLGHLACDETGCGKSHAVLNKFCGFRCTDNRFN